MLNQVNANQIQLFLKIPFGFHIENILNRGRFVVDTGPFLIRHLNPSLKLIRNRYKINLLPYIFKLMQCYVLIKKKDNQEIAQLTFQN